MFIMSVQHNIKSVYICVIWCIYIRVLCTDDMLTFVHACVLLATYSMLPYWIIIHAYILWLCYKYIWIFLV